MALSISNSPFLLPCFDFSQHNMLVGTWLPKAARSIPAIHVLEPGRVEAIGPERMGPPHLESDLVRGLIQAISGWWLNHPSEKYARQNGNLPQFSG